MNRDSGFTAKDLLTLAIVGVGAYALYKLWGMLQNTTKPLSNAIGDSIANFILPSGVNLPYSFILPNGSRINAGSVAVVHDPTNDEMTFTLNGIKYIVQSRDDISGDYVTDYYSISDILKATGS